MLADHYWVDYWHMRQREIAALPLQEGFDPALHPRQRLASLIRSVAPGAWASILAETRVRNLPAGRSVAGTLAAQIMRVTMLRAGYVEAQRIDAKAERGPPIAMMTLALDQAVGAADDGDPAAQLSALEQLQGFEA